jgi:hypothetical protein
MRGIPALAAAVGEFAGGDGEFSRGVAGGAMDVEAEAGEDPGGAEAALAGSRSVVDRSGRAPAIAARLAGG